MLVILERTVLPLTSIDCFQCACIWAFHYLYGIWPANNAWCISPTANIGNQLNLCIQLQHSVVSFLRADQMYRL
jgi:hypothetical protein